MLYLIPSVLCRGNRKDWNNDRRGANTPRADIIDSKFVYNQRPTRRTESNFKTTKKQSVIFLVVRSLLLLLQPYIKIENNNLLWHN